jgi:DNA primase
MAAGHFQPNDDKERVRDAADIVRVIGEHVALKPRGREYAGLCPFHDDHKPSMWVSPVKGIFKCFSCGAGGDVFTFVQRFHSMEFREALEYLAERYGVTLTPRRQPSLAEALPDGAPDDSLSRKDLIRANTLALDFFRGVYQHREHGAAARAIVQSRAISDGMVEAFAIGTSPDRFDGLLLTLQRRDEDLRPFIEVGLLKARETGGHYDAFRNRLIFPIHDQIGRVIAFGGRKINEEDEPKYLNSAESRAFDKSATLYGLFQAAREIQKRRVAVITEGYTDTIACHQAGLCNAVATLGTALTRRHASVLRRLCDTVVLLFDGDEAGQRAADRAVEVFFAEEIDVKIATLAGFTDAKDPDELLKREGGLAILERAIADATDLLAYRYTRIRQRLAGAGMSAINRAVQEELERLVELGLNDLPVLRRTLIIKQIAGVAGVDEATIARSIPAGRAVRPAPTSSAGSSNTRGNSSLNEAKPRASGSDPRLHALGCLLAFPRLWGTLSDRQREEIDPMHFSEPACRLLAETMWDLASRGRACGIRETCDAIESIETQELATDLVTRFEQLFEDDDARARQYLHDCLRPLATHASEAPASLDELRRRRAASGANRRVFPGLTGQAPRDAAPLPDFDPGRDAPGRGAG